MNAAEVYNMANGLGMGGFLQGFVQMIGNFVVKGIFIALAAVVVYFIAKHFVKRFTKKH